LAGTARPLKIHYFMLRCIDSMSFLSKIFGDANERFVEKLQPIVDEINGYEPELEKLSDEELKNKTEGLK
jgi:preprotein translocase subunit SecA